MCVCVCERELPDIMAQPFQGTEQLELHRLGFVRLRCFGLGCVRLGWVGFFRLG